MNSQNSRNRHLRSSWGKARYFLALAGLIVLGSFSVTDTAHAQASCPLINGGETVIASATSRTCSTSTSSAAPSVSIQNRIGIGLEINITPNTGASAPVTATCTGDGCRGSASSFNGVTTVICDSTRDPCNVSYSFPDANGDTVSGSFTAPPYGSGGATIDPHTVSGGVFDPDTTPPSGYTVSFDQDPVTVGNQLNVSFTFAGAEPTANYAYSISSSGGGSAVTGTGVITSADQQITGIDTRSLEPGTFTLSVTLTDTAGNAGASATDTTTRETPGGGTAAISVPSLSIDGTCTAANLTRFSATLTGTAGGGDTASGFDLARVLLTDGSGTIIGTAQNLQRAYSSFNRSILISTQRDPVSRPFTLYYEDVESLSSATSVGASFTPSASTLATRTFEPSDLDSDCPAPPDTTPPTVVSIQRGFDGASRIPETTDLDIVSWFVLFSEDITRPIAADFVVTGTTSPVTISSVGNDQYEISLAGGDIATVNGRVELNFAPGQTITDTSGNALITSGTPSPNDNFFTMANDAIAPTLDVSIGSSNANPARAKIGDVITVTMTADEVLGTPPTVTIAGQSAAVTGAGTSFTATTTVTGVTPEGEAAINISGYADAAGNTGALVTAPTSGVAVIIDRTAPTGYTVTLDQDPITVANNTALSFTLLGAEVGANYSATYTSASTQDDTFKGVVTSATQTVTGIDLSRFVDGTVQLDLTLTDAAGNTGVTVTDTATKTGDVTAPSLTSILRKTPTGEFTNADSLTWTVTFSEDVITVDTTDFSVSGTTASLSVMPISGSVYEVTASGGDLANLGSGSTGGNPEFVGLSLLQFRGITDVVGNAIIVGPATGVTERYAVWNEPMSVRDVSLSPPINPRFTAVARTTLTWVVVLDTADSNFLLRNSDFTVIGTTASPTVTKLFGNTFEVKLTGGDLASVQGPVTILVNTGIQDAFGNVTTNTTPTGTNESTVNVDNVAPVLTLSSTSPQTVTGPFEVRMEFSEPVNRFINSDLQVTNAVRALTMIDAQTYTALITPQQDGPVTVTIAQDAAEDGAANGSNPQSLTRSFDGSAPRLTSIERLNPLTETTNADSLTFRVTFSEAIQGLAISDLAVAGTTASLSISGSGRSYDVTLSGGNLADLAAATVSIAIVPSHTIQDAAGNRLSNTNPTGVLEVFSVSNRMLEINTITRVDAMTQAPVGERTNADTLAWNIEFGSISGGFSLAPTDFSVSGTTATVTSVNRFSDSFIVRASGGNLAGFNGVVTLGFSNTTPVDEFGNVFSNKTPTGVSETSYTLDNTAPTLVSIDRDKGTVSPTDADTLTFVFTFSENMDASAGNVANLIATGTTANISFAPISASQGTVTLSGGDLANLNGPVTIGLNPMSNITDLAGNVLASITPTGTNNNTVQVQNDATPPTVSVSTPPSAVNGPFDLVFSFTEDVTGLTASDFNVTNGTVILTGGPRDFTVTISPDGNGDISVNLPANSAIDAAGNGNEAFNATFSVEFDADPPTVTTSTPPSAVNGPFDLVFNFTEDMTGLTASDFNVTNGTVVLSGGPRDFIVTITPAASGEISVTLPAGSATDSAGNGNEAFNATFTVEVDITPPTVTSSTPPSSVNGPFDLAFNFSEEMTGLTADDFIVANGTVTISGGPKDFIVTITPIGGGEISVTLPAGSATDPAGNGNVSFNATFAVEIDTTPPTVTASTPPVAVNGAFDLEFNFSEDMTGLTADDFNVTNGTVVLAGGPQNFIVTITPDGNGTVFVSLPANSAFDPAGNGNVAFEATIEVTVDQTLPTLALSTTSPDVTGPFIMTLTFSEAVEGFDESDLTITNGSQSNFAGEGTVFTVLVTPETIGEVSLSVADGSAVDVAGNALVGSSLSVTASGGNVEVELEVTTTTSDPGEVTSDFTLNNPGTTPINFTAFSDQPWVDVTPSSGQIGSLDQLEFQIELNDEINNLAPGTYVATVTVQVDDPASAKLGISSASQNTAGLVLATVPVTVEVEERFGAFELVVQSSSTGPTSGAEFSYVSDIAEVDGLSVVAGVGESVTRIDQLLNGSYEITQTLPDGWRLESVTCTGDLDGGTVVDALTGKIDLDLDTGETVSCVFENARDDDAIRLATQRAIRNFMARRGDRLLETAPDLSTRFSERQSQEGGSFSANGSALRTQMDFRTSLAGFRNRAQANAVGDNIDLTNSVMERWDVWVSAEYARVEDERVGSGIDGKFFAAQVGIDYQVEDNLILGALVQYDWMSEEDEELAEGVGAVAGAQVEGDGFMVGPYAVWQVTDTLVLDAMGLWGTSDNTVNPLGYYEDAFETTRFMLRANATGEFRHGAWTVRPQLTWSHYEDEQDSYIDSLGIDIPSQTVTIGRLRAGPEVLWTQSSDEGAELQLGAAIRANWDYDGPGLLDQSGNLSNGGSDLRADGDLLIGLRFTNGASLRARVGIDGIGQGDFNAQSGRVELTFPFGGKGGSGSGASLGASDLSAFSSLMGQDALGLNGWQHQNGLGNDTLARAPRGADLLQQRMRAGG